MRQVGPFSGPRSVNTPSKTSRSPNRASCGYSNSEGVAKGSSHRTHSLLPMAEPCKTSAPRRPLELPLHARRAHLRGRTAGRLPRSKRYPTSCPRTRWTTRKPRAQAAHSGNRKRTAIRHTQHLPRTRARVRAHAKHRLARGSTQPLLANAQEFAVQAMSTEVRARHGAPRSHRSGKCPSGQPANEPAQHAGLARNERGRRSPARCRSRF